MTKEELLTENIKVKTRKSHPCGGDIFEVIRIGADIKLKCVKCSKYIFLSHDAYIKSVKAIIE